MEEQNTVLCQIQDADTNMMKAKSLIRHQIPIFAAILSLVGEPNGVRASQCISNLGNVWPYGGIGDIHDLGTVYDSSFIARFSTDEGLFRVNAITLEFLTLNEPGWPQSAWANVSVGLRPEVGSSDFFVGYFGMPTISPVPTQWPQGFASVGYTSYIDFHPDSPTPIILQPFTEYDVVVYGPGGNGSWASLLFTKSDSYASPVLWEMGPTSAMNPWAAGEFLKFAVDATPIPEPSIASELLVGVAFFLIGMLWGRHRVQTSHTGSN